MGAIEHLKTLCCLGLEPESAMVAASPLLHKIIPHGWTGLLLLGPDSFSRSSYYENPEADLIYRERIWDFCNDPRSPASLWMAGFKAAGIGWDLHMQGRSGWFDSPWYQEMEAPLDSCWKLSAMIPGRGASIAFVQLTRPRSARGFTVEDVQRLDRLRPWLAFAFRSRDQEGLQRELLASPGTPGVPVQSGQMIVTADGKLLFQTRGLDHLLLRVLERRRMCDTRSSDAEALPSPIRKLIQRLVGAATGNLGEPPIMRIATSFGHLVLEAKWLVPAGTHPEGAARDPRSCLIAVTVELREHPTAHAARVLRESGATPAQVKCGVSLVLGKTKAMIAEEHSIKLSSVADLTRRLYQTLDVHNSTELAAKIWLKADTAKSSSPAFVSPKMHQSSARRGFRTHAPPQPTFLQGN